jgi:hypothetical protein
MPRPPKRARLSESKPEMEVPSQDDKHTLFTAWAQERGVEINSVAPQQLPGRGLGLMTTAAIEAGDRLLFVPEKAMFKPDVAFVKRSGLERASPQAKLSVSIMAKFTPTDSLLAAWERGQRSRTLMPACHFHGRRSSSGIFRRLFWRLLSARRPTTRVTGRLRSHFVRSKSGTKRRSSITGVLLTVARSIGSLLLDGPGVWCFAHLSII